MKFPGKRKNNHYFPVGEKSRIPFDYNFGKNGNTYVVGIDQLLVDIEVNVDDDFLNKYGIHKGESMVLDDVLVEKIYSELKDSDCIVGEFAGGAVGNTLHNYSVLSDDSSIALGSICKNITVGDYAFKYISTTCSNVDFSYLQPCDGAMARCICFVTPDNERSFAIGRGIMNDLAPSYIPDDVIRGAGALLITTFLLRDDKAPLFESTMKAVKIAKEANIPVVLSMGTSFLVEEKREFLTDFIKEYVSVLAMNDQEAKAFVNEDDALLAGEKILEFTDLLLLTVGAKGLYLCGHVSEESARHTKDNIHSKSIPEYNKYEYSRAMLKRNCNNPIKIYTHINPYMGGPGQNIKNTNGAGDAALAAVLHDVASNAWHKEVVPNSPKHKNKFLTYSSLHQICKYANRVSYEVLIQNSPRLSNGLPTKEDSLEETYWER